MSYEDFCGKKFLPQIFEIPTYQLRMNKLRCGNRLSVGKAPLCSGVLPCDQYTRTYAREAKIRYRAFLGPFVPGVVG